MAEPGPERFPAVIMLLWDRSTRYAARLTSREPLDFEFASGRSFRGALVRLYRQEGWTLPDGHDTCPEPVIGPDERVRLELHLHLSSLEPRVQYAAHRETFAGQALGESALGDTPFHALAALPDPSLERGA